MPEKPTGAAGRFRDTGLLVLSSSVWLVGLVVAIELLFQKDLDAMDPAWQNLVSAGVEVLLLVPPAVYMAVKRIRPAALFRPAEASQVISGAFVGMLIVPVSVALSLVMLSFVTLTGGRLPLEGGDGPVTAAQVLAAFLAISIAAPIIEEVEFRALILGGQAGSVRWAVALLLTGLLFTMQHGRFLGFPSILMGGLVLTYLAQHSGSIWPSVAAHFTYNSTLLLFQVLAGILSEQFPQAQTMAVPPPMPLPDGLDAIGMVTATIVWIFLAMPFALSAAAVLWGYGRYTRGVVWPAPAGPIKPGFGATWPWMAAFVLLLGYLALDLLQIYGIIGVKPK